MASRCHKLTFMLRYLCYCMLIIDIIDNVTVVYDIYGYVYAIANKQRKCAGGWIK